MSNDPDVLLEAARFTTGDVRMVRQEPAPSKFALMSTSKQLEGFCETGFSLGKG